MGRRDKSIDSSFTRGFSIFPKEYNKSQIIRIKLLNE